MKTVFGTFQNSDGTPVKNGRVFFNLSEDASALGTQVSSSIPKSFNLNSNGSFSGEMFANDEFTQSGTTYLVAVLEAGGGLVWKSSGMSITGSSPINLNGIIP